MSELIYKQDAKDAVDMALDTIDHVPEWVYDILLNSLDKVPSAEPDLSTYSDKLWKLAYERGKAEGRKKGKWDFMGWQMFQCSECKHTFTQDFLEGWKEYTYESHFPPFCPNCGADMREGEEE